MSNFQFQPLVDPTASGGGGGEALSISGGPATAEVGMTFVDATYPFRGVQIADVAHLGGRFTVTIEPSAGTRSVTITVPGVAAGGTSFGVAQLALAGGIAYPLYVVAIYDALQFVLLDPIVVGVPTYADIYFEATYTATV